MTCGLLGERLGHSYSPALHALYGDYPYQLFEVPRSGVEDFWKKGDWHGLNVTIPYKKTAYALCDALAEAARAVGSVNTVVRQADGTLLGDNTDAAGFEATVRRSGIDLTGKKCLVLGSGGASLAVQYVLRRSGAGEVAVLSRNGGDHYPDLERHRDGAILVNATPVGMYPDTGRAPVDLRDFPACEGVFDLIYNPLRTALLQQAEGLGIPAFGGLYMLAEQARRASERFTGRSIPQVRAEEAERAIRRQKENLVLIGMPGCGKTTVGRALAKRLGRPFADTDEVFSRRVGLSPADFLRQNGEAAFRREETKIIAEVGQRSGQVIATGGGVVTRPENYPLLHQNGALLFLERDLASLPTQGRPLSQGQGLTGLYARRLPLYRQFADITLRNDKPPEMIAKEAELAYENFSAQWP